MKPIVTKLAGVIYEDGQENIKKWGCEDIGSYKLIREPNNPHDPNAIRVALFGNFYVGYVPEKIARQLAPKMDEGKKFLAFFVRRNEHPRHKRVGLTVRIEEIPDKKRS
jgi:hypothetical protein